MSAPANDLAVHLRRVVMDNPDLAYLIGPGSRTWELLVEAIAGITGETPQVAGPRLRDELAKCGAGHSLLPATRDMLEALREARLANARSGQFVARTPECQASYDKCVAAIAKAEGRS